MKNLALPLILILIASGCVFGPSPERNVLASIQLQKSAAESALVGWNDWLGVQQTIIRTLPDQEKNERIGELREAEKKILVKVNYYNKAQISAKTAWDEYEWHKSAGKDTNTTAAFVILRTRAQQLERASGELIDLIGLWNPAVKALKEGQ